MPTPSPTRRGHTAAPAAAGTNSHEQHLLDPRLRVWTTIDGDPAYRLERRTRADATLVLETERPLQRLEPHQRARADSTAASFEERWDTKFDRSRIPDVAPAILSFFLDDDARLWVLARTPDSDSLRTLDAHDAEDGQWLGTLTTELPIVPNPRPVVRGDRMWVVVRDELDVPYVVRGGVGARVEGGAD